MKRDLEGDSMIDRDRSATDAILSSQAILSAQNCPQEMLDAGDVLWRYVGDVSPTFRHPYLTVICRGCAPDPRLTVQFGVMAYRDDDTYMYNDLVGMRWLTDDLLEVVVYWGRCKRCGAVYWAKKGPPFTRLMRYCPVAAE